jgi:methionyl-tRNA formyltransferase
MSKNSLRVVFAGTPAFAASHLNALIDSEHQLLAVYTQPDRPAGRGRKLQASPVKQLAEHAGIPVYQPESLKDQTVQQQLTNLGADVMVVVAYGLILPQAVLEAPRSGCLNVHASLLPRWRGAAPIQRAIEAGDSMTGITIMQMDVGLDTGAMLATSSCPINAQSSSATLHDELAILGPPLLLGVLGDLPQHQSQARQQDDNQACYAAKILKPEGRLDWSQNAITLDRRVRAFNPFPVCFGFLGDVRIRIWQARVTPAGDASEVPGTILRADGEGIVIACGEGALTIEVLQLEGGKALTAEQLLRAHRAQFAAGQCFDMPSAADR